MARKMSLEELAAEMGITFQAVQKYEDGRGNISLYRLRDICTVLAVDWGYFLEPFSEEMEWMIRSTSSRTTVELLEAFERITDGKTRRALITMAEKLAEASDR